MQPTKLTKNRAGSLQAGSSRDTLANGSYLENPTVDGPSVGMKKIDIIARVAEESHADHDVAFQRQTLLGFEKSILEASAAAERNQVLCQKDDFLQTLQTNIATVSRLFHAILI